MGTRPSKALQRTPGRQYGFSWHEGHTCGPVLLNFAFAGRRARNVAREVSLETALDELAPLFFLCLAEGRSRGQGENNHFLAGYRANVVVQTQHLHPGDLLNHRFHHRPRRLPQMSPHLFE